MKFRKIIALTVVFLSSFAASNVAPSKTELESMYDKAFRAFDANNFPEALLDLEAIDARQPDLAESQNLRGVIYMRQGIYDKAEAALDRAVELDPKFWNARFNLAEIPFLQKNWDEARHRFEGLLSSNSSELQGEATQLIQYKILLTYVMEGKDDMVDSLLSKFELSSSTPAVQYANAAIAFQRKDEKAAKDDIATAEKNFSPQLNKLFAESFYEIGWLQKPAGQTRAALELTTAAERATRAKGYAKEKLDAAEDAFQRRDLTGALQLLDEAEVFEPNQASTLNLRGEVLMEQKDFDKAEDYFKKALKIDPKLREAQYNLAQIPFKKKEYGKARDRLEALFASTPGGDKNQAAQLIKFKIFMTLLLEGKDSRAQKMMDQFQFTGDTPALYYAQAAWEFKHNNPTKANDWIASARKIYSLPLNIVFADPFYDVGWLQSPAQSEQPASSQPVVAQAENAAPSGSNPLIEPSPIPGAATAENQPAHETGLSLAPSTAPAVVGMEATTATAPLPNVVASPTDLTASNQAAAAKPSASISAEDNSTATVTNSVPVKAPEKAAPVVAQPVIAAAKAVATPATVLAPARIREWSQPTIGESLYRLTDAHTLLFAGLLAAGIALLTWVIVTEVRRRTASGFFGRITPVTEPSFHDSDDLSDHAETSSPSRFKGGPPQRSLQLKASEPSVRRAVIPVGKLSRGPVGETAHSGDHFVPAPETQNEVSAVEDAVAATASEQTAMPSANLSSDSPAMKKPFEPNFEPITQGQPVPHQTPAADFAPAEPKPERARVTREIPPPVAPPVVAPEFVAQPFNPQSTKSVNMPEPTQTPVIRTAPSTGAAAPAAGATQTAVQLTFSCEIAALQLTPSFKMGALQLKPTSRVVMMRLSPSQHPQPAMNLQITFEVATVQGAGAAGLGTVRLTPSQQQKPVMITSPAFNIAGLQLVAGSESAPVQLTPSQQGKASVLMTAAFNIGTVEFSPSFEIASIVLNSTSKTVSVQLPGAGPSAIEGAPVFEISNVQAGANGEIGLVQLTPSATARRA